MSLGKWARRTLSLEPLEDRELLAAGISLALSKIDWTFLNARSATSAPVIVQPTTILRSESTIQRVVPVALRP